MAENDTLESQDRVPDDIALGSIFPSPTREQWEAEVLKVLNRRRPPDQHLPIDKALARLRSTTVEGITIDPLYTADDRTLGFPAVAPFSRGATIRSGEMDAWDVRQLHEDPDAAGTRQAVLNDLERGGNSVWLRTGSDAINPADVAEVLGDVLLDLAAVVVSSRADQVAAAAALAKTWKDRGTDLARAAGNLGLDALGLAAITGTAPDLAPHREWVAATLESLPGVRALTVDVLPYHDAGASDVDELGLAVATGVAYLRDLEDAGISPADAFAQLEFRVSATADQFLTIARLRALRRLWARVGEVVGVPGDRRGARQHAVTSWRMMSRDDAYVNVLRTTIACFAAYARRLPRRVARRLASPLRVVVLNARPGRASSRFRQGPATTGETAPAPRGRGRSRRRPRRSVPCGRRRQAQEAHDVVQVRVEVRQRMVAAVEQLDVRAAVVRDHLAPVEHFVALGDDREVALEPGRLERELLQLVDVLDAEEEVRVGVVEAGLLADVLRQVARRVHGGVEQHRRAADALGDPGRVVPAQRAAEHRHARRGPAGDAVADEGHRLARRRRQLRAPPDELRPVALQPGVQALRLERLRRRAEAVQVQQVGRRRWRHRRSGRRGCHTPCRTSGARSASASTAWLSARCARAMPLQPGRASAWRRSASRRTAT